jgi:uncharacterized membrane protein (DUF106 family)
MKENKSDTKKMLEYQKSAMDLNMKYMMHSLKPTIVTFIPVIIIFGWLSNSIAYEPIIPGQEFTATLQFTEGIQGTAKANVPEGVKIVGNKTQQIQDGKAQFGFKAEEGNYLLAFTLKDDTGNDKSYEKEASITRSQKYAPVTKTFRNEQLKSITLSNQKLIVLNLFGWKLGWLGTYIITSIIFSMGLRKLMNLH